MRHIFIAKNCHKIVDSLHTEGESFEDQKGYDENTQPVEVTISEFRRLLRSGQMTDIEIGYLGLDYLKLLQSSHNQT